MKHNHCFTYSLYNERGNIKKKSLYKLNGNNIIFGYLRTFWKTKDKNTWKSATKYVDSALTGFPKRDVERLFTFLVLAKEFDINEIPIIEIDTVSKHPNIYLCFNNANYLNGFIAFNISKDVSTTILNRSYIKEYNRANIKKRYTSFFDSSNKELYLFDPKSDTSTEPIDMCKIKNNMYECYVKLIEDLKELKSRLIKTDFGDYYVARHKSFSFGIEKTLFEHPEMSFDFSFLSQLISYEGESVLINGGIYIMSQGDK